MCHHYELNDDFVHEYLVADDNVVAVGISDLKVMDDDQQDDLNKLNGVVAIVVENALVEVVKVAVEDVDENDDVMGGQADEVKQKVSVVKLLALLSNVMMIEAKCK